MLNDYHFNKIRYDFFAAQLIAYSGRVKANKSCEWMVDVHRLGCIDAGFWYFTEKDRAAIIALVKQQSGCHLLEHPFPGKRSRTENALLDNNEKRHALAVTDDFVLVNALQSIQMNQQTIDCSVIASLGLYINSKKIKTVEHKVIVLVENLAVMANLQQLVFSDNAVDLKNALWVYRGDIKAQQNTHQAYQFFRQFISTHQLICFADFDPEGLHIAISSSAMQLLAPSSAVFESFHVKGAEQDYYNQITSVNSLTNRVNLSPDCQLLLASMKNLKKTIKQEHILSHQIPLQVFEIN